jgi:hypothetical protein
MTRKDPTPNRDEVLFAFHQASTRPTGELILDWIERYPEFADDIRAHAAVSRDWAAREAEPIEEPSEVLLARAYSRTLSALYDAEVAAAADAPATSQSFHDMLARRGEDIPGLARTLVIARGVLAALFNGGMLAPVGDRLVDSLVTRVTRTREAFDNALRLTLASPRLGHAKSKTTPKVIARSFEEIVRDSDMSEERKRYWLGKES